jgi:hypothetical protein
VLPQLLLMRQLIQADFQQHQRQIQFLFMGLETHELQTEQPQETILATTGLHQRSFNHVPTSF